MPVNKSGRHERCYSRRQQILDLEHYLDALSRKPGALAGSTALAQWRVQGRWKEPHDQLWRNLNIRHGRQNGTRAMIEVILLGREHGYERLEQTIRKALELGCSDAAAIRHLLLASELERKQPEPIDASAFLQYDRPILPLTNYDSLLSGCRGGRMSTSDRVLREESVRQYCRALRLPTVGGQFGRMAEEAIKQQYGPVRYLEALLAAEIEERERNAVARRIFEAKLPRMKTLEDFDFAQTPQIAAARIHQLAEGGYIQRAEPLLLIGEPGTGKTHLASGLCVAACRQRRRTRFTTAAALVNELVEAKHSNQLSRLLGRWSRYELIAIDELGYVPLAEVGAELLFQVIADRAEKAAVIITTNLPFSEWPQVFPNARLCKAMLDRLTDRAHIIETGTESFRFRRTIAGKRVGKAPANVSEGRASASP